MLYLKISPLFLKKLERDLPFNIFYFNPFSNTKGLAFAKGEVPAKERIEEILQMNEKGFFIEIREADLNSLKGAGLDATEILIEGSQVLSLRDEELKAKDNIKNRAPTNYLELFKGSSMRDNFDPVIKVTKEDLASFSTEVSVYQTQLKKFLLKALTRQSYLVNGCSFLYFLLKKLKKEDELEILEVMTAYFLKDIGISQISFNNRFNEADDLYRKHPMLSIYFMIKFGFEPSKELKRYILEPHERINGTGFPREKAKDQIHPNSLLISLVDHVFYLNHQNKQKRIPKILEALDNNVFLDDHIAIAKSFI
jgi:hypothetical protein